METKTKEETIQFSDEEMNIIGHSAYQVWDECAYDLLTSVAEEKGKDVNSVTVSRSVAIEIALDAGRCEERMRRSKNPLLTPEFWERYSKASYKQLIKIVKPKFTYSRYGM